MKDKKYLYNMFNATATDDGNGDIETYENWLEKQLLARIDKLEQLALHSVSNSLKVGMQTFDLCDCPYQINTWIEKYNIQANNIISINQDSKQVVLFYKAFNDC
ncbi:MAG: hypothetical protein Tsb0033_27720 [Winogradskyella sp.]